MQDEVVNPVVQVVLDHMREQYTQTASILPVQHTRVNKCIYFMVFEHPIGIFLDHYTCSELKLRKQIRKKKELLNKLAIIGFTNVSDFWS